jgi:beta-barrel assembly-enhancing protease
MITKLDPKDVMPNTFLHIFTFSGPTHLSKKSWIWRVQALALSVILALGPVLAPVNRGHWVKFNSGAAFAQGTSSTNLPRLGDPSGADISPSSERRIGEAIVRQMLSQGEVIDDWEVRDYLARLSAPLIATNPAQGFTFDFFPVRDIAINAFALPGGYIGINAGLLLAAQSESEVASVLAHEIGHITQRHVSRMVAKSKQVSVTAIAGVLLAALAAASNPQAAVGVALFGDSLAQDQMLAFSRDAEREADRVGFDILSLAGFEVGGMLQFFTRLQQAYKLVDVGLPVYVRSHPLTSERISDVQSRLMLIRYKQRADSVDFALVRAKLRALVPKSENVIRSQPGLLSDEHKRSVLAYFNRQVVDKEMAQRAESWYGLAIAKRLVEDYTGARAALLQARKRMPGGHTMLDGEAIQLEYAAGQYPQTLSLVEAALKQYPAQRHFIHLKAKALARHDPEGAANFLDDQLKLYRSDKDLWSLLSEVHFGQKRDVLGHRAQAEAYAAHGLWMPAMEQLRIAQALVRNDYYNGSQIDSRLKEFERNFRADQQAKL